MRAPRGTPKVGAEVHHPYFAGGCTAIVMSVKEPLILGNQWRISVRLVASDGHKIEQRGRSWGLSTWFDFVESARSAAVS